MGVYAALDDFPSELSKWAKVQLPKVGDGRWFNANQDIKHEWIVYLSGDRPSARLRSVKREQGSPYPERQESYPPMPFVVPTGHMKDGLAGEWSSVQVSDGWLIGYNAGEWGSWLWWFSPDGKRRYRISEDQIVGFFKTEDGLFAMEGIAHGSLSRGRLVRMDKGKDGRWRSKKFVDLGGAPEVAAMGVDGSLTVATHDRLLRVDLATKRVDVMLRDVFWGGLYPKSMILTPSGAVYLGMRHGVAEIKKLGTGYEPKWLLPNAEFDRPLLEGFK